MSKMMKKTLFIILILFAAVAVTASYGSFRTVSAENEWGAGDTYYIYDENDFMELAAIFAGNQNNPFVGTIELKNDISLLSQTFGGARLFGTFGGVFEGNNHTISGIRSAALYYIFEEITDTGTVQNLKIADAIFTNANTAAGLANINFGTIDNVKIQITVSARQFSGITNGNFGLISNSIVIASLKAETVDSAYGFAQANYLDYEGTVYDGDITYSYYIFRNKSGAVMTVPDVAEEYKGDYIPATGLYITDGKIEDIFDFLYYEAYKDEVLTENGGTVTQTEEINVFNAAGFRAEHVLDGSYIALRGFYNNINAGDGYIFTYDYGGAVSVDVPKNAMLDGDGSETSPYLIKTVADLKAVPDFDGAEVYFKLENNIYLLNESEELDSVYIAEFNGIFDGSGYAVTDVNSSALFGINKGIIKNLYIRGIAEDGSALLLERNESEIENISVLGEKATGNVGKSALLTFENEGTVSYCSTYSASSEDDFYVVTYNGGVISKVRNFSELPFIYEEAYGTENTTGGLFHCYNQNSVWVEHFDAGEPADGETEPLPRVDNSVYCDADGYFSTALIYDTVYGLVKAFSDADKIWGYISGLDDDIPALVFKNDNRKYKSFVILDLKNKTRSFETTAPVKTDGDGNPVLDENDEPVYEDFELPVVYDAKGVLTELSDRANLPDAECVLKVKESDEVWNNVLSASDVGEYFLSALIYSTQDRVGDYGEAYFTITEKHVIYTYEDFRHISGVVRNDTENGRTYNAKTVAANDLKPLKFVAAANFTATVTHYEGEGSGNNSSVLNAGFYRIALTASHKNYIFSFRNMDNSGSPEASELLFRISKADLTVTPVFSDDEVPYATSFEAIMNNHIGSFTREGLYDEDDYSLNTAFFKNNTELDTTYKTTSPTGFYSAKLKLKTGAVLANYNFLSQGAEFEVVKAYIPNYATISLPSKTVEYDGQYHSLEGTGEGLNGAGIKISYNLEKVIDKGSYTIEMTVRINDYYYDVVVGGTLTITQKRLTITASDITIDYLGTYAFDCVITGIVEREDEGTDDDVLKENVTYTCGYVQNQKAGEYDIIPNLILGSQSNYTVDGLSFENGKMTVNKIDFPINIQRAEKVYSGNPYFLEITPYVPAGAVTEYFNGVSGASLGSGAPTDKGIYSVRIEYGEQDNYLGGVFSADFEILPSPLTDEALHGVLAFYLEGFEKLTQDTEKGYMRERYNIDINKVLLSDAFPNEIFIITYKGKDAAGGNISLSVQSNLSYATPFSFITAGTYTVTSVTIGGNSNFTERELTGFKFTVKPIALTIAENDIEMTYTGKPLTAPLSYSNPQSILQGDSAVIKYTVFKNGSQTDNILETGDYVLKPASENINYSITSGDIDLKVVSARITLKASDIGQTIAEYGKDYSSITKQVTFILAGESVTETLRLVIGGTSGYPLPQGFVTSSGLYNVISADAVSGVTFVIENGLGLLRIDPKTLTFDWADFIAKSYVYKSAEWIIDAAIPESYWQTQRVGNDVISATITIAGGNSFKDTGDYTATAAVGNIHNYKIDAKLVSYAFEVTEADAVYTIDDAYILFGAAAPQFSGSISGLLGEDFDDAYTITLTTDYKTGDAPGEYRIYAEIWQSDNYGITVIEGVLHVDYGEITGVIFNDQSFNFSWSGVHPVITIPNGATAEWSRTVFYNAAEYPVTVTVKLQNYRNYVAEATITVNKGTPVINKNTISAPYNGGLPALSEKLSATYIGTPVFGSFTYQEGQTLTFGLKQYKVDFVPDNQNISALSDISVAIDAYLEDGEVQVEWDGALPEDGDEPLVLGDTPYKFSLNDVSGFGAKLYVNGKLISGGEFEIDKEGEYIIEIKIDGQVCYSRTVNAVKETTEEPVEPTPIEPTEPEPQDPNGDGSGGGQEPKKINWGVIGGIAAGVIVIIIIIVIIAKKKNGE